MKHHEAAIFDMDGVLVDSYHAHYESWLEMARREGLEFREEDFARTFGRTSREIIAKFWRGEFSDAEIAAKDAEKEAAFRRIIEASVPAMPGAVELLRSLREAGFRLAVGSSAPRENVDLVLDHLGLRPLLSAVVTGGDVVRGKPDPQVFLLAAERMGLPPGRCVVVEDAPVGITAAKAAGMRCVGFASTGHAPETLAQADLVVGALAKLSPDVLRRLIGSNGHVPQVG